MEHAILPPSSAHRWVKCPGSVQAEQLYPDVESDGSREGTAAHWVGEQILLSYQADANITLATDYIGQAAPNGVVINEEMAEGAQMYIRDVLKVCQEGGHLQSMRVEQRVAIDRVHNLNWGTPDLVIWDAATNKLYIWDFKFGRVPVESYENWQIIDYAIGVIDEIDVGDDINVELRIVQPRAFHPEGPCRSWTIKGTELRGYANQLQSSADEAMDIDPPTKAGDHCRHCKASRACSTLQREGAMIADRVEVLQLHDLSPENTAVELRYLRQAEKLLKERLGALEAQALEQTKNGTVIPGFSIGYGRGSVKWDKSDSEVIALGDLLDIDLRKTEKPITPIQAMNLNVDEAVINRYSKKHQGAARLVTDDKTIAGRLFRAQ